MADVPQMTEHEWKIWRQRRALYDYDCSEQALYDINGAFRVCTRARRIEMLNYILGQFSIDPSELSPTP